MLFPRPQPTYAMVPSLPEGGSYLLENGFYDFALGFAQNDRVGSILQTVKVLGLEKLIIERNQTYQPKGICCYVYRILINARYTDF